MCVGLDTHKAKIAVAVAEPGRSGEVRFRGEIANRPEAVRQLLERLAEKHGRLRVCYEAGPCGYGLHRQIIALGHDCTVVAPSLIPRKPGERVKTNRRDALTLARLLRAGELTAVWIPDPTHEAMRDLVRARRAAMEGSLQESDRCVRQAGTDANAAHAASSDGLVLSGRSWPGPGRSPVSQA